MKSTLAVIPARGESKRIPRKNIKNFFGHPVIKYSIDAARESGCFDEVMVSTEDREIARIAEKNGAAVPFLRSKKNAGDYASTADVIEEVLLEYRKRGRRFAYCCCIYPAAPFILSRRINEGWRVLKEKKADSVIPVTNFSYPIQRALRLKGGKLSLLHPENLQARTQDLEVFFHDTAQFYWLSVKEFLRHKKLFTKNTFALLVPASQAQDIDNQEDWDCAQIKYMALKEKYRAIRKK